MAQRRRRATAKPVSAQVSIEEIGAKADGLAKFENRVIRIPYTAPGDVIIARIAGDTGWIETMVEGGADRQSPPCSLYGECGGCSLQHVTSDFQRRWKEQLVLKALECEGVRVPPLEMTPPLPTNSRRRATLSVRRTNAGPMIGFKARRTHRIVPLSECHILTPDLFAAINQLPQLIDTLPASWLEFSIKLTECETGIDLDLMGDLFNDLSGEQMERLGQIANESVFQRISLRGEPLVFCERPRVCFDDISVAIHPGGFLQASEAGQSTLLKVVSRILENSTIPVSSKIADLFSGCGAFSLPLARSHHITAVDSDEPAITALLGAARSASGLNPVTAYARDLFKRPLLADELSQFDAIIFDPPRAGAPAQVKQIIETSVPHIIGVSCNPASFARDARILGKGGYHLNAITLVDQFAYSPHIELVAHFSKQSQ